MPDFCYTTLEQDDESGLEIRLLYILPAAELSAPIRCELRHARVHHYRDGNPQGDTPEYEALSYVWGNPHATREIVVNNAPFPVTVNLEIALRHLRYIESPWQSAWRRTFGTAGSERTRILWVDALCIDQANLLERGHQVQNMFPIFRGARRVLAWLGTPDDNSDLLFDVLNESRRMENDSAQRWKKEMDCLFKRAWFHRIWIIQEVAAAKNILFACGQKTISGPFLLKSFRYLPYMPHRSHILDLLRLKFALAQLAGVWVPRYSILELVEMFHAFHATDHRDKVFALLGMSIEALKPNGIITPDYTWSLQQTYEELIGFTVSRSLKIQLNPGIACITIDGEATMLGKVTFTGANVCLWELKVLEKSDQPSPDTTGLQLPSVPSSTRATQWAAFFDNTRTPVMSGDTVCLLSGAMQPTIIRTHSARGYTVVRLAVTPQPLRDSPLESDNASIEWKEVQSNLTQHSTRRLLQLIWTLKQERQRASFLTPKDPERLHEVYSHSPVWDNLR